MRVNFRQGIVGHQTGTFLSINGNGNVDLLAANRQFMVNLAHRATNYIHSEDQTVQSAWVGPFVSGGNYWLYESFNPLTFDRSFGVSLLEPVAQSAEPGDGDASIDLAVAGAAGIGFFEVPEHYVLPVNRPFSVYGSTANNGVYTVASAIFDGNTGKTTIYTNESIPDSTPDGNLTLDVDRLGIPLLTTGRHWFDTSTNIHYVRNISGWSEVLRVFVAHLKDGTFSSVSIDSPAFTGTQIGYTGSVFSGRVLFDESLVPQLRDDTTFLTTEDQFFTNQSRIDGIRLESNVSKAQNIDTTLAPFSVIAYAGDGQIRTAQYNDTSETVIGLLTEGLANGEVGSVILQGVVTNADWNWLSATTVGSELWVDNGILVILDPHVVDPVSYAKGKVPVARVLSATSIIFEQGLGGKGDKGPTGSIANIPPATTTVIGGVTLLTASSDSTQAFVISDTDSRLTDSRNPLPHLHQAVDITFVPGFGISSNNLQNGLEEVAAEKLDVAGGTMTGTLILDSNPTNVLEAVTKQYVDNLVSGLIWIEPIDLINLISNNIFNPPGTPFHGDAYIVPPGASGDWSAVPSGNIVLWNTDTLVWDDLGPLTGFDTAPRFGIAMSTTTLPSGSFTGWKNGIATYDAAGSLVSIDAPLNNNAVYVHNPLSHHAYDQYAYSSSNAAWTLFSSGQDLVADGTTISVTGGNIVGVIPASLGGQVDAFQWQGLIPTDLDAVYAGILHIHTGASISANIYNSSPDWGTLTNTSNEISAANVQLALQDITDGKAAKLPTYLTAAHRPVAANVEGMFIFVQDVQRAEVAMNGGWVPLTDNNGLIYLPYDLSFHIVGSMQPNNLVGSFMITRNVNISIGAVGSFAYAETAAAGPYSIDIIHKVAGVDTIVGSVDFAIGNNSGSFTLVAPLNLVAGDIVQLKTPGTAADAALEGLSITIVGCAPTTQCS